MPKLAVGSVALHYQCTGEGEDVVLIHGLGANLAFWYPGIVPVLSREYRVTVYDIRGHGRSAMPRRGYTMARMVDDLNGLLDGLSIPRAHIVGHSFGARVALHFATAHPGRVTTLTVADTQLKSAQEPMRLREWPHWPQWKRQLQQQGFRDFPSDEEFINFRLLAMFAESPRQLGAGRGMRGPTLRRRDMGRRGSALWKRLMEETSARQELEDDAVTPRELRRLPMPTLAVFGEYSHCLRTCHRLQEWVPRCEVALIPRSGHFHPAVKPGMFIRVLRRFLRAHSMPSERPPHRTQVITP